MTLLSLQGVTRRFGGLVAVDAINLDVAEGGVTRGDRRRMAPARPRCST